MSAPQESARPRTSARHKARKHALDLLFECDLRGTDPVATLEERAAGEVTVRELTSVIVRGVAENVRQIDATVSEHLADGWTLSRMPVVDRAILRIGIWEILYNDAVPHAVAIDEAVEAAKILSTDDSAGFVNGLLGRIAQTAPSA